MNYQQYPPPLYLQSHVKYFWTLEDDGIDTFPKSLGPLVDGCTGIVFQENQVGYFIDENQKKIPELFLYGQTVSRTRLILAGRFKTIGVCFFPHALKSIFGFNSNEITDHCIDVKALSEEIHEILVNSLTARYKIEILGRYIHSLIQKSNIGIEQATAYAVKRISASNGNVSLQDIQRELGISERTLQRKFEQHVGVSPKLFSRICQFRSSLQQIKTEENQKFTNIAYDNGFADQSHFIRTFKKFTGFSPSRFKYEMSI